MRHFSFKFPSALGAFALTAGLWAAQAQAQPCCAGTNVLTPARLAMHEDELVAVQVKGSGVVGSFDATRTFLPPGAASEIDLEQDLLGTVRFLGRGQVSLAVPILESGRSAGSVSQFGGGFGDLVLSGRWDFVNSGEGGSNWPGIAALAGVTFPTGRPPESPDSGPLGAGATGAGAWQGGVGFAVEQNWRHLFALGTALLTQSAPRHASGLSETLGLQLSAGAAAGWAFDSGPALGITLTYVGSRDATIDGQTQAHSGRGQTLLGLAFAKPIGEDWRLQGTVSGQLPISGLGQNEPSALGLSVLVIRGWM